MIRNAYIIIFLALVLIGACREESKYREFLDLSLEKQHEEFQKYPVEKQYDIYVYAMRKSHPPNLFLADSIASRGEEVIPFLMDKLAKETDEGRQEIIIYIFEMMVSIHKYDLKDNQELITLLRNTISSMKFDVIRESSEEYLQIITGEKNIDKDG